jgi:cobalt transporter subunit CbtB
MEALLMAQSAAVNGPTATPVALPVIPVRELLPWAIFAFVIGALLIYFVGAEEGATSVFGGTYIHEFVHDGRHLLGFPCH